MIELAHIALPRILEQRLHGGRIEALQVFAVTLGVDAEEVRRQHGNIFTALAQGRQVNLDGVETEQQILAEAARGNFLCKVCVRGGDHSGIHSPCLRGTDALHLADLEHTQQLGLQV